MNWSSGKAERARRCAAELREAVESVGQARPKGGGLTVQEIESSLIVFRDSGDWRAR